VDGNPGNVRVGYLDLTGVEAGTDTQAKLADRVPNGAPTGDGTSGAVEGSQEPVAHGLDFSASEAFELTTHEMTMALKERAPALISELRRPTGRSGDVGEEHGSEHALCFGLGSCSGGKVADLVQGGVGVPQPVPVIAAFEFDKLGGQAGPGRDDRAVGSPPWTDFGTFWSRQGLRGVLHKPYGFRSSVLGMWRLSPIATICTQWVTGRRQPRRDPSSAETV